MKIHEYQGQADLSKRYWHRNPQGLSVLHGRRSRTRPPKKLIDETKIPVVVVKAQIHAGGRGKGGGVKVVKGGPAEARAVAEKILEHAADHFCTKPAPRGQKVQRLYVEQGARYRARAVPGLGSGSRTATHRRDGLDRRRRGDRNRRRAHARKDHHRTCRSSDRPGRLPSARAGVHALPDRQEHAQPEGDHRRVHQARAKAGRACSRRRRLLAVRD